jgi:hypothetical protein
MLVDFDAGPEPTRLGQPTRLVGRTWYHPTGNVRKISFYHRETHGSKYVYMGHTWSDDEGHFSRSLTSGTSGTWYARVADTSMRPGTLDSDYVRVVERRTFLRSFSGRGEWAGPRLTLPSGDFVVTWRYRCASGTQAFWNIGWNGRPHGYRSLWRDGRTGIGTYHGDAFRVHDGTPHGWFEVGTLGDCRWKFWIHSGARWEVV